MTKRWWWLIVLLVAGLAACGQPNESSKPSGWNPIEENSEEDEDPIVVDDEDDDIVIPDPTNNGTVDPELLPDGADCRGHNECDSDRCVRGECSPACNNDDECDGLACVSQGPGVGKACVPANGAADGEACTTDSDCQGGTCITDWPGGFCTTYGCDNFEDCSRLGNENKCLRARGPDFCVRICQSSGDCREDYVCEGFGDGTGACVPDPAQPLDPSIVQNLPFEVTCEPTVNGRLDINYSVAADTSAYMITPVAMDGRQMIPDQIARPNGNTDLRGLNAFQSVPSQIYGGMNPTVVPPTAQFTDQLASGDHTYSVLSDSAEICWYQLEETEPGNIIDMNIYLVGVPGIDASNAGADDDMNAVLAHVDSIYASSGIKIRTTRFFDIVGTDADNLSVLRSEGDLSTLVALSQRPGPSYDEIVSINIFFVRALAMGGAIGISAGLPGPAGLHGTHGSGVAFTTEYMGQIVQGDEGPVDGNIFTGQVLAHEVGHWVGLFHTSESNGFSFDPLPDTPECGRISFNCPDVDNLMFPFAGETHLNMTADQAFVLGVNPLTKYDPTIVVDDGSGSTTDPNSGNSGSMGGN